MPKTQKDILYAMFEKLVGPDQAKLMQASFEQQFIPSMGKNKKLDEPVSDEDFAVALKNIEKEAPAFAQFLLNYKPSALPPNFGKKN